MTAIAAISQQIWDMKYRFKPSPGTTEAAIAEDKTVEDTWRRVATALAAPERPEARDAWVEKFYQVLIDFKFLPAGRILAGAGTGRDVTLFNCFVMGRIPDSLDGIFEHLKEAALTMQQGGGIGYDFSTLRPKGAPVKGVGADASGPLSFMDVWDAMCRTIMSAGYRRGAMMATMRCDHPDIEAFIDAKAEQGRLRMFNLSVLVSDAFMAAVKNDEAWELKFDGRVWKSLRARALWDKIMRATYAYAEPGVIFIDRINAKNNLYYCEEIFATNPCVPADTWVHTAQGPRQVRDLVGVSFEACVDGKVHASGAGGFFFTGRKPVVRLQTCEGYALRLTADHRVRRVTKRTRYVIETAWAAAGDLCPEDEIILHNHRGIDCWEGRGSEGEGYLIGLLVGDGVVKTDKAVLSVWPGALTANGDEARPGVRGVMETALAAARALPHRADFQGWVAVPGRGEYRLSLASITALAAELGLMPGNKAITPAIESASSEFCRGFLCGLFDADGSIQGSQTKGISIRLSQSDEERLQAVQRMLLRFGIVSTIYRMRRPAMVRDLPDGKGAVTAYHTQAQHELVISGDNMAVFAEKVGFADTDKARRLTSALASYARAANRERFFATVLEVVDDGEEDVFDVAVPGINAFDANGLYVHNCGEQPLPPYGACLLGSINLARLVSEPFTDSAHIDEDALQDLVAVAVRMMDNVIDISRFPLPAQRHEAQAKRRIGLGVTGLADALIMCGKRYGSPDSLSLIRRWMRALERASYGASADIAAEKGSFPLYDKDKFLAGQTVLSLDDDIRAAIAAKGIRNALLTSIAPTGTISLFADNVSSGLEPVFSFSYMRKVLMPDGSRAEEEVSDYAYRLYRRMHGDNAPLPDSFVTALSLSPLDHVRVQAAVQEFVDSSISKTINCPEDISFEDFKDVYLEAFDLGCKGCTTYRPNEVTGAVLEVKKEDKKKSEAQAELPLSAPAARPKDVYEAGGIVYMTKPLDRPEVLPGQTYKVRWPDSDHAIYITLNDVIQDGRRRPFEVFINSKNMEHYAWTVALTRMISAVFRRGGDVSFVVEELKAVFDPRGGHWVNGHYVPSLLAAIGEVIEQHMIAIGFITPPDASFVEAARRKVAAGDPEEPKLGGLRACPKCNSPSLIRQEGCDTCVSCGYSKCG